MLCDVLVEASTHEPVLCIDADKINTKIYMQSLPSVFRIVLAEYPTDVQACSAAIGSLFSAVVVYLDLGNLVAKQVISVTLIVFF